MILLAAFLETILTSYNQDIRICKIYNLNKSEVKGELIILCLEVQV